MRIFQPKEGIRWGTERRLEFIEFRLFWEEGINRSDIVERFGVSVPQASADISLYQQIVPDNLLYDASQKRYVPAAGFVPYFLKPSADKYLEEIKSIADGVVDRGDSWLQAPLPVDAMSVPRGVVDIELLRSLVQAVRNKQSIEIEYQSMNVVRPDRLWRRITPHAFGFDGVRWHVRAYCHISGKFKDFRLSRCSGSRVFGDPAATAEDDVDWNRYFEVVLVPHKGLSESQRKTVALDYAMSDGRLVLSIRIALLFYFFKRMRLDFNAYDQSPYANPIEIVNEEEFLAALATANAM
jgi:hypothetical protein